MEFERDGNKSGMIMKVKKTEYERALKGMKKRRQLIFQAGNGEMTWITDQVLVIEDQ